MLQAIVSISLRQRGVLMVLALLLLVYGLYVATQAKLDVFPEFVPPQVGIQCEAPGLAPEQVETLVTRPIETGITGISALESVRSQSVQGLAIVTAIFREGTNILTARQMLGERLAEVAGELPQGVQAPKMQPLTSATMDLLKIGLTADAADDGAAPPTPMELRTFADWVVRPRLLAVQGVASVNVYGGDVRQLQIEVMPDRLAALDLTLDDVLAAGRAATGVRGAGFVDTPSQRIVLQSEGQANTPEEIGDTVVTQRGAQIIRLRDVARVRDGAQPKFGEGMLQGRPAVLIALLSQYGANTLEVTDAVEQALDEMEPSLMAKGITLHRGLFRPASFVESAIRNINHSLLLGSLFVAIVLFVFLWNLRTAFICLTVLPLSLLAAIVLLDQLGATLNTITLGGLVIAIGVVVDDAIIDVENIFRRLRENAQLPTPRSAFAVVLDASMEVRGSVVYATFLVIIVFVPVLTMSGLQGKLFAPLAWSYILAVLASLGVALTVTPAMAMLMLPQQAQRSHEPRLIAWFKSGYSWLLGGFVREPALAIAPVVILCAGALWLARGLGGEFLPEFREGHFVTHLNAIPGTSLAESARIGKQIAETLLKTDKVLTVPQQIGRAELGEDPWGPHRSEFHINITPNLGSGEDEVRNAIREAFEQIPGVTSDITTFLGDRIGETISGETAAVVVSIYGDDLDVLDQKAEAVRATLAGIPGAVDVQIAAPPGAPQTRIRLRHDRLTQFGFRAVDVLDAIQTAYQGTTVAQTFENGRVFDVVVVLDESQRQEPEVIGSLLLTSAGGTRIPLSELTDIYGTQGRFMLLHDEARRRQAVTCNVEGRDVSSFVDEAKAAIGDRVSFPAGTYPVFGGEAEARAEAEQELLIHTSLAGIGIILLLMIVMRNLPNLLLVLLNLPFALVGGVVAVYLTGASISIGGLVGFVTLFGITTRNSIMLMSHYEHLVVSESQTWGAATAIRGASERLVPILMTALVTGLGLLPIAIGANAAGREIEGPMAIVILGGLTTSTLLNLLVLPTLALAWGRFEPHVEDGRWQTSLN
ncbi:MAG: efflux RND transporter permease subunit [Phycisphaerales bacterium]|nr:efflux RND transporter permease subunit [Phycisphaerales bacterium]